MKNLFIQLKAKANLKQDPLLKILEIKEDEEKPIPDFISQYFEEEDQNEIQTINFILKLIPEYPQPEVKEKLFALLVFFVAKQPLQAAALTLQSVSEMKESIFSRVRLYSYIYLASLYSTKAPMIMS